MTRTSAWKPLLSRRTPPRPHKSPTSKSDNNKIGIQTEWVIRKASPKTVPSETKKYNVSIVLHLHHSKNEPLGSQDHT